MIISIRLYLHSKESKKGTRSLYMDVRCDGVARLRQATGETLKEKDWNPKKSEVRSSHDYAREINARLERLKLKVQQEFREMMDNGQAPTGADLRTILRPLRTEKLLKGGPVTVVQCYESWKADYLRRKNRGVDLTKVKERELQGYNYARSYSQVVQAIEGFRPGATVKDLSGQTWDLYLHYLYEDLGVEDTTVATHVKGWKELRKFAGLSVTEPWLKNTYNREKILPDLSWAEISKLARHAYSDTGLQEVAHAFVIDCQLALRWGDLSTLNENHLLPVNTPGYGTVLCVKKRQGKTGQPVLVPLPPLARELFYRYKVVPIPRASRTGMPSLTEYNKRLKKAAKEAGLKRMVLVESFKNGKVEETYEPLHQVLTSHSARHTAASRIREASDYETAQLVLGHASKGNVGRYAHLDPGQTAERILKAWEYYR